MSGTKVPNDQANTLRKLARSKKSGTIVTPRAPESVGQKGVRVIAVTSGKGGVGKSNMVVNLAISLARLGRRVLVIDADLGVGNIDVLLGLSPAHNLNHVLSGEMGLGEIILQGPAGIKLVPAGSGVQEYTSLGQNERIKLLDELDSLEESFDIAIIDTEAGISENVTYFNTAAQEIVVVASPEPTSITDVYALIKLLATRYGERYFKVLVNMVNDTGDALEVFARLSNVTSRFLDISLDYLGCVVWDEKLVEAVKRQRAVCDLFPEAQSSKCFASLARRVLESERDTRVKGNIQFFFRQKFAPALGLEML
ncbi:MinD/ParA family protein [Geobacter argillaceus]|uniref:Flagellar biosynthesis protein FlhG n=1 Tax=Geobacter argillaceus TaxID=345631 RepID=A0A562VJF3_9BACT|nr:MinD/ParA family protein [Geobacter argillaceus]TWJ18049.1 flagellar biosynthesis protein FlhG [Geobacter argillaceus]